ncbi:MAG: PHP domain-containing protein [Bacteroidota bacterium]
MSPCAQLLSSSYCVRADLHTHTTASDGRLSPPGLVEKAALRGIELLSITDHDTVAAYPLARIAAQQHGVTLLPGVELSVQVGRRDIHLLAYGFDLTDPALGAALAEYRTKRITRAETIVERLAGLGVRIRFERVWYHAKGGVLGRPHIAKALLEAGLVATFGEAFDRYLGTEAPAYVAKTDQPASAMMALVHAAGGVTVLAHPGINLDEAVGAALVADGLDGVEVVHPSHNPLAKRRWAAFAAQHDLLTTGGSDYHGFGTFEDENFGSYTPPSAWVERLLARVAHPEAA